LQELTASKEAYYLTFNRDEIFKNLIASEGHFRNLVTAKDDVGFLNCIVKHLADAEGHCDEAISHALIVEGEDSSKRFLDLRETIKAFRKAIQTQPMTRDKGIREIRRIRRLFEGFNEAYDVSKCETCGDPTEISVKLDEIINKIRHTPIALHEADDFLNMEKDMADKVIKALSEKYNIEPPKLIISDKCHEPHIAAYHQDNIYVCRSGINLHVLIHEFAHHMQKKGGKPLKEDEAEKYAIDFFNNPQKTLYALHNHVNSDKALKSNREIGLVYAGDSLGVFAHQILQSLNVRYPGGFFGQPVSTWGDLVALVGSIYGAQKLDDPWDTLALTTGAFVAMDLYNVLLGMVSPSVKLTTVTVPTVPVQYTTQNNIAVKPVPSYAQGRYIVS